MHGWQVHKALRKQVKAAEKAAAAQAAVALAGGAAAQQHDGGLECWAVHSVHGKLGVDLKSLGGQQVPPTSDETIFYIVFGTFAKSEQEYDSATTARSCSAWSRSRSCSRT